MPPLCNLLTTHFPAVLAGQADSTTPPYKLIRQCSGRRQSEWGFARVHMGMKGNGGTLRRGQGGSQTAATRFERASGPTAFAVLPRQGPSTSLYLQDTRTESGRMGGCSATSARALRLGRLEIGDISHVVAAGSPHRETAFRACAQVVDRIKHTVPIWRNEYSYLTPICLIVRVPVD